MQQHFVQGWICLVFAGLVVLGTQSCSEFSDSEISRICSNCNVILVLVDTLRADHLSLYGYGRETSPNIDRFAEGAITFDSARSQASCTWPSANALLTSRYPFNFLGNPSEMGIPEEIMSLPELLKANGYWTIAVSGSPIVRNTPSQVNPRAGFGRGFDVFEECECVGADCSWRYKPHAKCINRKAGEQMRSRPSSAQPFFLYLHYMDAHGHYDPPGSDSRQFGSDYEGKKAWIRHGNANPIEAMLFSGGPDVGLTDTDLQHLIDLYDDEIYYFDWQLRRLLDGLDEGGLAQNTIVILTSDHGEEFMEHNSIKHCHTLFDNEIRIPLVLRIPGNTPRGRRKVLAESLDLFPTLVDYLGLDSGELRFDGVSLRSAIEEHQEARAHSFSSQIMLRSVTNDRFKLIYNLESEALQLYDLEVDPLESIDIAPDASETVAELKRVLFRWLREVEGNESALDVQRAREIAKETEQRLRALGYTN